MVMRIAITASLNASRRPLLMDCSARRVVYAGPPGGQSAITSPPARRPRRGPPPSRVGAPPHSPPPRPPPARYRRYAAVVADTDHVRIFVFGLNRRLAETDVEGQRKKGMDGFSSSEARFQRHVGHVQHRFAKEVAERLERIVREERIETVILAGDDVALPLVRAALPAAVLARVSDALHLDAQASEHKVLRATLEAFHRYDARTDADKVRRLLDEFRAGGLGVVGVRDTRRALEMGQVDELLIAADPGRVRDNDLEGAALED